MKYFNKILVIVLFLIITGFSDIDYYQYSEYTPIIMKRENLEKSVFFTSEKTFRNLGKIYAKDSFLYITEKYEGVHVINNSNPSSPVNTGFINAPGCIDISIKGSTLYLDNAVDLVAVDLTNYPTISVTERVKNIFPEPPPPGDYYIPNQYLPGNRPKNTIIVKWIRKGESI